MARPSIVHKCSLLHLIGPLIDHIAFIWKNWADIVLFFLSSDEKYFVLGLDRCELLWQDVMVPDRDLDRSLGVKLVNEQRFLLIVVVVETRLDRGQNVVWFERNHVVKETAEFIYFAFYLD